jgi:hypothetical protein
MKKKEKIEYVTKWKNNKKNKQILDDGGLLEPKMGDFSPTTPIKFMSGIFISISAAHLVVPFYEGFLTHFPYVYLSYFPFRDP